MALLEIIGIGSTIAAGVIAQIPVTPGSIEELSKWPVTLALIALAAFSVWLAFRMADKARESQDRQTKVLSELVQQMAMLNERIKPK